MAKLYHQYNRASWSNVKKMISDLQRFADQFGEYDLNQMQVDNLWYLVSIISHEIGYYGDDKEYYMERQIISLLEEEAVKPVIDGIKFIDQKLSVSSAMTGVSGSDAQFRNNFANLNFKQQVIDTWAPAYVTLDQSQKLVLNNQIRDLSNNLTRLQLQISLIVAAVAPPLVIPPYSPDDVQTVLFGSKDSTYNPMSMIQALRDARRSGEMAGDLSLILIAFLGHEKVKERDSNEWIEHLILGLMLDLLFYRIDHFSEMDQRVLFVHYFYKAITFGIPVREFMSEVLRSFANVYTYLNQDKFYVLALSDNEEAIPLDTEGKTVKQFQDIVRQYRRNAGSDPENGYKQNRFLDNLYGNQVGRDPYVFWLREMFSIYFGVMEAQLINWEKEKYVPIIERVEHDMAMLAASFGYGENFEGIVEYFSSSEEKLLEPVAFVRAMAEIVDLEQESDVDKALRLTEVLHENNIIDKDIELIEFHEEDGKFHWNTDLSA